MTGTTFSPNFPILNALQSALAGPFGAYDAFVTGFTADGELLYSSYLGGSKADLGYNIALDRERNIYLTGVTSSTDFPTENPLQGTYGGPPVLCVQEICGDVFVAKLNRTGSALIYATYLGGRDDEAGLGIAADAAGNAYVTGFTTSTNFPTRHAQQRRNAGDSDAFVLKLNPTGSALLYSTYLGGSAFDQGSAIAVDALGNAYIAGRTNSFNFPFGKSISSGFHGRQRQLLRLGLRRCDGGQVESVRLSASLLKLSRRRLR